MKACVQWDPFTVEKISPQRDSNLTARSISQHLTYCATEASSMKDINAIILPHTQYQGLVAQSIISLSAK